MKNTYKDIAFIWQVHNLSSMARVGVTNQRGEVYNYVVICCMPSKNGVYSWKASNKDKYGLIMNNKKPCYCVPIEDLQFVCSLEDMPETLKKFVKKSQQEWLKYVERDKKPDWFLK